MMAARIGRTIASPDAINTVSMFVIDDEATWLARRPQDLGTNEQVEIARLFRDGDYVDAWRRLRVKIADERRAPPAEPPYNINPNRPLLYAEGTTYFLPVMDLTHLYINGALEFFREESGFFFVDDKRWYLPTGVGQFARSNGGHLNDDPRDGKVLPISLAEQMASMTCVIEQGMALQNLALTCEAIGLGGFPHFAAHPSGWFDALGFRMEEMALSKFMKVPTITAALLRLKRQDAPIRYPLGLERDGEELLRLFCPPYYDLMREAVEAVIEYKFGPEGVFGQHDAATALSESTGTGWQEPAAVARDVPRVSEQTIDALVGYCEYIWARYGRFPATIPPYFTVLGFQAGHLDESFYAEYDHAGSLTETHRKHMDRWHDSERITGSRSSSQSDYASTAG